MTSIRQAASALIVITAMLTMSAGLVLAQPTHEVCTAMRHDCGKFETTCCCGDRSDQNPSSQPGNSRVAKTIPAAATSIVVFDLPMTPVIVVCPERPLSHPPDLRILFSDLRI